MMKLYYFPECPYCQRVLHCIDELKIGERIELILAYPGSPGSAEVKRLGGKVQVPFLVDGETKMYESEDICEYLEKKYGQ